MKKNKGFSLIELLVVVAIIGILATVVFASLGQARERAQQKKFIASLSLFRTSLELFYLDQEFYPSSFEYYPSAPELDLGRSSFSNQMQDYFDTDEFIKSVPRGLTEFIYYGVYTTGPNGGSAARCPGQPQSRGGQTFAITFVTQELETLTDSWQHDSQGDFNFYCIHP